MPYALKMDGCTFLNGPYRKYAMPSIKPPATDLPYTDDHKVDICEMFKQNGGVMLPKIIIYQFPKYRSFLSIVP